MTSSPDGFASWFYLKDHDFCVCVPAKCGVTSFMRAVWPWASGMHQVRSDAVKNGYGPFTPRQVAEEYEGKRKVQAVRHPVDRFASLWRDKCRRERYNHPYWYRFQWLSPDELLDSIEEWPLGNSHWFPQWYYMVPGVELVRFDALVADVFGGSSEPHNSTNELDSDPQMPVERILEFYGKDLELWNRLLG